MYNETGFYWHQIERIVRFLNEYFILDKINRLYDFERFVFEFSSLYNVVSYDILHR